MKKVCRRCKWLAICLPLGPVKMYQVHRDRILKAVEEGDLGGCDVLEGAWKEERESGLGSEQRGSEEYR